MPVRGIKTRATLSVVPYYHIALVHTNSMAVHEPSFQVARTSWSRQMREANCCIVQLGAAKASVDHKVRGLVLNHVGGDRVKSSNCAKRWRMSDVDHNDVEQNEICIGDDPSIVLDQYLCGEELEELVLEEGDVFDNDLPYKTSRIDVFDDFQF